MTPTPNTPITQDNVGLLKAGDWLHDGFYDPWQFDRIENDVAYGQDGYTAMILDRLYRNRFIGPDLGDGWIGWSGGENPVPGMRVNLRLRSGLTSATLASHEVAWDRDSVIAFRPALSPPAEGEAHLTAAERAYGEERAASMLNTYPTPTPAPGDWNVVGPKLVEAVKTARDYVVDASNGMALSPQCVATILNGGNADRLKQMAADDLKAIDAALAATHPQSNGE